MAEKVNQGIELQMAVVPQDWLDELNDKLDSVKNIFIEKSEEEINSQWIESMEARKLLGVLQKTWQTYSR